MPLSQPTDHPTMPEVHDRVLDILLQWQAETEDQNRFFYLKRRQDERFKKGSWFPGNNAYLAVSCWSGSDNQNKTSNAFLEIHRTRGCSAVLTARDSKVKRDIFQQWTAHEAPGVSPLPEYRTGPKRGQWSKGFSLFFGDFETCLRAYLRIDKPIIDELIRASPEPIGDEIETPLSFIPEAEFTKSLAQVQRQREIVTQKSAPQSAAIFQTAAASIRLSQLIVRDFYGIKGIELLDLPARARWIFLTGENAAGKTIFLRALALALSGQRVYDQYKADKSWLRADIWLNDKERVITRSSEALAAEAGQSPMIDDLNGYLAAYGPSRLLAQRPDEQNRDAERETAVDSLFNSTGTALKSFDYEFSQSNAYDPRKFDFLKQALITATDGHIRDVVVELSTGRVLYDEAADGPGTPIPVGQLATGLRSIVNLVGDIYVRLAGAQDVKDPAKLVGIVIIDELENHLHPKLQKALPQALSKVFPKVQFIASTHSPIPFLGAPKDTAFIKVSRDAEGNIAAERIELTVDFTKLLPDALFSSPLFGFEALTSVALENVGDMIAADSYDEAKLLAELKERFSSIQKSENSRAEDQ